MKKYILIILFFIYHFSYSNDKKATDFIAEGIEYLHSNNYEKAIFSFNESQKIIDKNYAYQEQFLIYNNLGLIYYKMSEYKEATRYFEKAYGLAKSENKPENEMTVLNNLAILFIKVSNYEIAKKYLEQAFLIAKNKDDDVKYFIYAINLASVNFELKNFEACKNYLKLATQVDTKLINNRILISYRVLENCVLLHEGKTKLAIKNLIELLPLCINDSYDEERLKIYHSLIYAYHLENNYQACYYYINLGFNYAKSNENKRDLFNEIAKISFDEANYEKAIQAKDSVIKYNEIIQNNINKESIENARLNFELTKSAYEIESQQIHHKKETKLYLIIIIFFAIVCLLIFSLYFKRNQNIKQKNLLINQNLLLKEYEFNQLLDSKLILEAEIDKIKISEIDKAELNIAIKQEFDQKTKIRDQLFEKKLAFQTTRNELLFDLVEELTHYRESENEIKILEIIQKLKIHLKDDLNFVKDIYQKDFKKDLFDISLLKKHPNLNTNDLKLLTLIYLQTETKEIAQLLFITPETVRKRKERIKIKLELDKNIDLYNYLHKNT